MASKLQRQIIYPDRESAKACRDIAEALISRDHVSRDEFFEARRAVCSRYRLSRLPGNGQILALLPPEKRDELRRTLMIKPVRTASGIAVIAVMTKPQPCPPQARCVYCPGGVNAGSPKSYTGYEPAALRGLQNGFDSYREVQARLRQLDAAGHRVEKCELIIMGGTFLSFPLEYQRGFVKGCFDALNGEVSSDLEGAKRLAETAKVRNVGVTIETRPDFCREAHVDLMLEYGVTRVEIGVQTLDDEVYRLVKRGHTVNDVAEAFRVARDSGLKIVAHMMPGLPGSTPEKDLAAFQRLFQDPAFKPDMLKIYPTLVVESAELYRWWLNGSYTPYDLEMTVNLLADVKRLIPGWVRVMRIQRDIPARLIQAGVKRSNLRELILEEVKKRGYSCRCIRCREVGLKAPGRAVEPRRVGLVREQYDASGGREVFLSLEDKVVDAVIGLLRLRVPSADAYRPEIRGSRCTVVRELHVYGPVVPIGLREDSSWQHRGFGRRLMEEAERISREEFGAEKVVVTSGIGARMYFRKLGYTLEGAYMVKQI